MVIGLFVCRTFSQTLFLGDLFLVGGPLTLLEWHAVFENDWQFIRAWEIVK
jgi:hypothetical protein